MSISPYIRTIKDLFSLERVFIIPRFQREYSWDDEQLDELWDDLLSSLELDKDEGKIITNEYFIGTSVFVGDEEDSENSERQVVDGQQRLMTVTMMFSALIQAFKNAGEEKLADNLYKTIVDENADGDKFTRLVTETPKPFFNLRVLKNPVDKSVVPKSAEEKLIANAIYYFENRLEANTLKNEFNERFGKKYISDYIELLKIIRDQILRCYLVYVTVPNIDEAYAIFEILNAKGKNLTSVDIIKNKIFSVVTSTEPLDIAKSKWDNIRKLMSQISNIDIEIFFRHYWLSKYSYISKKNLVKDFKKRVKQTEASYINFLTEIENELNTYTKIAIPKKEYWRQPEDKYVFGVLEALNLFRISQIRTLLLSLFKCYEQRKISSGDLTKALRYIERYHFIYSAICSLSPSGLERKYSSFAIRFRESNNKTNSRNLVDELIESLEERLPSEDVFNEGLSKINYLRSRDKDKKFVQYILKKVERYYHGTLEIDFDSFSIEHILSESSGKEYAGEIGNLLPLCDELNSEADNKDISDKILIYKKSQYKSVINFVKEFEENKIKDWDKTEINERTEQVAKILYSEVWK